MQLDISSKLTPEQDAELVRVGKWVIETCLLFGAQRKTAYLVAGYFIEGVERAWRDVTLAKQS